MSPAKAARSPAASAKPKASARAGAKKASPKSATKASTPAKKAATPKFGRSGTAGKGEGDGAVQAWISGIKPEHQDIARRFDALVGEVLPGVRRAVKWSTPFYGLPGKGWVATMASFKQHMSLGFFAGAHMTPPPPEGDSGNMRRVVLRVPEDYDERDVRAWLKQAGTLPGWGKL